MFMREKNEILGGERFIDYYNDWVEFVLVNLFRFFFLTVFELITCFFI